MLITVETSKDFDKVVQDLQEISKSKGYGVMAVYEVHNILEGKGFPINYKCTIVEICNPKAASQALSVKAEISTLLPCRVSVIERGDKVVLSSIAPTEMLTQFKTPELEELAKSVEADIKGIIEEAAK